MQVYCLCWVPLSSLSEKGSLVSSGGGNQAHSCLACDFCLDTSTCCDKTYSQQTRVKVLGCHGLLLRLCGD